MRVIIVNGNLDSAVVCSEDAEEVSKAVSFITNMKPADFTVNQDRKTFTYKGDDGETIEGIYCIYPRVAHISG